MFVTLFRGQPFLATGEAELEIADVTFGPFSHVHGDSHGHLVMFTLTGEELVLHFVQGRIYYDLGCYAEWMLFAGRPEMLTEWDEEKAIPRRRKGERVQ